MKKLIRTLERLKVHYIKNDRIISPLSKEQGAAINRAT